MAIIQMPDTLRCGVGCRIEQATFDVLTGSEVTGSSQARPYGMPHWVMGLVSPAYLGDADAGAWKALLLSLRGSVNVLAAYDPARPAPLGTLRGAPVLANSVAYGAVSMVLAAGAGQAGATLVPGDWLQIGAGQGSSQLVLVTAPAVADGAGNITVNFEAPLRQGFAAGTAVAWQRARGYFRRASGRTAWAAHCPGVSTGLSIDLVEAW